MAANKKGLSPLIATVILVAFTMAVAAILIVWITDFTRGRTAEVSDRGEKQILCSYSTLEINKGGVSIVGSWMNITVDYVSGSEKLNITGFTVRDKSGYSYINNTVLTNTSSEFNLAPGSKREFRNYNLTGSLSSTWDEVRVTALCQNQFAVIASVRNL